MDPVLHLVRNAVSHGLESVEERIAAGKPPEGTISLTRQHGGRDRHDRDRRRRPRRSTPRGRGPGAAAWASPCQAATLDDAALLDLLCAPGFSTREESDRVSGRGFGMAVVRTTVQELGGSMRMLSAAGRGTRFQHRPATDARDHRRAHRQGRLAHVCRAAGRRCARSIEVDTAKIRVLEGSEVTPYRGGALPVIRLSRADGDCRLRRIHAAMPSSSAPAPAPCGLLVDRVVGQREIVVRATTDPLIRVEGIAGATDLGDGRAVLILDVAAVARGAGDRGSRAPRRVEEIA